MSITSVANLLTSSCHSSKFHLWLQCVPTTCMSFFSTKITPPQEPCSMEEYPPIRKNQLWEMEVITFEGSWLLDQLRQEPMSPVPLDMHCLEALIFAHKSRAQKWQPFAVPMYPTDGPINAVICQLAQWALTK